MRTGPNAEFSFDEPIANSSWLVFAISAVPAADLTMETMAMAATIAAKPFATVRTGKHAFYEQLEMPLENAYHFAAQVMTENMLHAEANEGIGAFLEKRPPKWLGK